MEIDFITQNDLIQLKNEIVNELASKIQSQTPKKWLRSKEVRTMLGISPGTLQQMRINGTIPFSKMGSMLFYSMEDLQSILEENKNCGKS